MAHTKNVSLIYRAAICACLITAAWVGYSCAQTQIPISASATVAPAGQYAPVITVTDQTMRETEVLEFDVLATDQNAADKVTFTIEPGAPSWLSIVTTTTGNPAKLTVKASPPSGAIGNYKVSFNATDDSVYRLSTVQEISIIVNPLNNPPVITLADQTVVAGQRLTFTMDCTDADSADIVTLTFAGNPAWLTSSSPQTVTGNPIDISFDGTPQVSDIGTSILTITATDNGTPAQTVTKTVQIKVIRENHPPVLEPVRDAKSPVRLLLAFRLSAMDPDNDHLTYTATGAPFSIGATFDQATGAFAWTPTQDQAGVYPVHFEVTDQIATVTDDITVTITANDAPVFDPYLQVKYGTRVGSTLKFAVTAQDPNNDPITYSAGPLPAQASFDPGTHAFSWAPITGQEGQTYEVIFFASDGSNTTPTTVKIFVNSADAPVLDAVGANPIGQFRVRAGQTLSFDLHAVDPQNKPLTYAMSNAPGGAVLTGAAFSWTPTGPQVGIHNDILFTASNGTWSDSTYCNIIVDPAGTPVIERIGNQNVVEERILTFTVHANDPDGLALTYLLPVNAPVGSYFDAATHTFTWKPKKGEKGTYDNIIFEVTNGINSAQEIVWIFVSANDAPVVDPIPEKHIRPGQYLSFSINAFDPNGDQLTYKALNLPDGALFQGQTFSWVPTVSQINVYKDIFFEVTDGINVVTVSTWIYVDAPAAPKMNAVGEIHCVSDQPLIFTVSATDPNSAPLTYSASNLPTGASFDASTRTFTWTPSEAQVGTYPNVLFSVTNGTYTDTAISWIFVKSKFAPTIFIPGEQHVRAGTTLTFTVTATDPNVSASMLTYSASNLPLGSSFENQLFTWTPTEAQIGQYPNIYFTVSNGTHSDTGLTWIFVEASNAPRFTERFAIKRGIEGEPLSFSVNATDPVYPASDLVYTASNLPPGAIFTGQTFRWESPTLGEYQNVRLEVRDPAGLIDSFMFWVIIDRSVPPVLNFIGDQYGSAGAPMSVTISATDQNFDSLIFSASNLPSGALFTDNNNGTAVFTWANPQAGTYTNVHFEVSDGTYTDSENITIHIN